MASQKRVSFRKALEWCNRWPETADWLDGLATDTKKAYSKAMFKFCMATGKEPPELLEMAKEGKKVGEPIAERWLKREIQKSGYSESTKMVMANALKSFYSHNYYDLAKKSLNFKVPRKKPYRCPTQEELRNFKAGASIRDMTLVDFMASAPVREGTLVKLKWRHVWKELIEEPREDGTVHIAIMSWELKGGGRGIYAGVEQHPFLHREAIVSLLRYKDWRERTFGIEITPDSPLFSKSFEGKSEEPLTEGALRKIFREMSDRTGLKFSPHDLRRFVETQLEAARLQPNWIRKIMGKTVKGEEAPYSRPKIEQLRAEFIRAYPYLTLQPRAEISERDRRINMALDQLRMAGYSEYVIQEVKRKIDPLPADEAVRSSPLYAQAIKELAEPHYGDEEYIVSLGEEVIKRQMEEIRKRRSSRRKNEPQKRVEIVSEAELPNHLVHGWVFKAILPSGKILIERSA